MNKAAISPRSCSSMWRVRIGDSPIRMPATKAPSTVLTPISCVISAIPIMMRRIMVMTGKSLAKLSLAQRIRLKTMRRPTVRLATMNSAVPTTARPTVHRSTRARRRQAQRDGDDDPADGVLEDRRSDDDLAEIAAHEIHLAHHHGDDLHRRDRQRGAEKDRRDQPRFRVWQQRGRQEFAEHETADKRQRYAGDGDGHGGAADAAHQRQVGFHAGQQQQHQDAELRNGVEHALLRGVGRKQRVLRRRPDQAEQRRPQHHPGNELAHHRAAGRGAAPPRPAAGRPGAAGRLRQ